MLNPQLFSSYSYSYLFSYSYAEKKVIIVNLNFNTSLQNKIKLKGFIQPEIETFKNMVYKPEKKMHAINQWNSNYLVRTYHFHMRVEP